MFNPEKNAVAAVLVILVVAGFFFFYKLGERSLYNPDEGRYAEVAREMVLRNDWVEPRLFNVDYLAKPILFYWLTMVSFKLFGFTEFAARLMPVLFGLMGILATFFFVKRTAGLRPAFFTALILASSFWYMQVSRFMLIDIVFAFFIFSALYAYYIAVSHRGHKGFFYLVFYVCLGFAFLAKGFACFILTGFPIGLYLVLGAKVKHPSLKRYHIAGILIFLAIISTWLVRITMREPEFLESFVVHDHIKRFTSDDFEHQQPWFFFLLLMPVFCIPWTFFLIPIKNAFSFQPNNRRDLNLFLLCTGLGILFFFSVSQTKLATYCMPAFPFLCILLGYGWDTLCTRNQLDKKAYLSTFYGIALTMLCGIGAVAAVLFFERAYSEHYPISRQLAIGGCIISTGSIVCFLLLKRRHLRGVFYVLICAMLLISIQVHAALTVIVDKNYSSEQLVHEFKKMLNDNDIIYIYGNPNKFYDLPFYLEREVSLIDLLGELKPTDIIDQYEQDETISYITKKEFIEHAKAQEPFYCVTRTKEYRKFTPEFQALFAVVYEKNGKLILKCGSQI